MYLPYIAVVSPVPFIISGGPCNPGTGLQLGALNLQGGNNQIVMCRSQLMDREALQHVLQTVAYAQQGWVCSASLLHVHTNTLTYTLKPTNREAQQSGNAQCP